MLSVVMWCFLGLIIVTLVISYFNSLSTDTRGAIVGHVIFAFVVLIIAYGTGSFQ